MYCIHVFHENDFATYQASDGFSLIEQLNWIVKNSYGSNSTFVIYEIDKQFRKLIEKLRMEL